MEENGEGEKTLFELHPELELKLIKLREMAKELGLLGKVKFS